MKDERGVWNAECGMENSEGKLEDGERRKNAEGTNPAFRDFMGYLTIFNRIFMLRSLKKGLNWLARLSKRENT
jgi:hypothetical protein